MTQLAWEQETGSEWRGGRAALLVAEGEAKEQRGGAGASRESEKVDERASGWCEDGGSRWRERGFPGCR